MHSILIEFYSLQFQVGKCKKNSKKIYLDWMESKCGRILMNLFLKNGLIGLYLIVSFIL